ncbi:MAG: hypothetical protein HUK24_08540, partial [Sphaerochaetaceae bacterium]|nr:hypothetical protein [Sphaerochaetaceae bacterium]
MTNKEKILEALSHKSMTQRDLAFYIYGNYEHSPNIYTSLQQLKKTNMIEVNNIRPAVYSLKNNSVFITDSLNNETSETSSSDNRIKEIQRLYESIGDHVHQKNSKILYITGCSKKKSNESGLIPAYNRYIGPANTNGLQLYANQDVHRFDCYVFSAGYGFIKADEEIEYYDISFDNPVGSSDKTEAIKLMAKTANAGNDFQKLLNMGYNLIILRIGKKYCKALNLACPYEQGYQIPSETRILQLLPSSDRYKVIVNNHEYYSQISVPRIPNGTNPRNWQDVCWSRILMSNEEKSLIDLGYNP